MFASIFSSGKNSFSQKNVDNKFALYYNKDTDRVYSDEIPNVNIELKGRGKPEYYLKMLKDIPDEQLVGVDKLSIDSRNLAPESSGDHRDGIIRSIPDESVIVHEIGHNLQSGSDRDSEYKDKIKKFRKFYRDSDDIEEYRDAYLNLIKLEGAHRALKILRPESPNDFNFNESVSNLKDNLKERSYRETYADQFVDDYHPEAEYRFLNDPELERTLVKDFKKRNRKYVTKGFDEAVREDLEYGVSYPTLVYPTLDELEVYAE